MFKIWILNIKVRISGYLLFGVTSIPPYFSVIMSPVSVINSPNVIYGVKLEKVGSHPSFLSENLSDVNCMKRDKDVQDTFSWL